MGLKPMECPSQPSSSEDITVSLADNHLEDNITTWRDTAFQIALDKLIETNGNLDIFMQTGEAFGRALFSQLIPEKPTNWTLEKWAHHIINNILTKLGHELDIEHLNENEAILAIQNYALHHTTNEPQAAALFEYSMIRGLLRSVYPKGEVILSTTKATGAPLTQLILKANAISKDKLARHYAKQAFSITKKL
ncbi:MAG: hypothetical protein KKG04_04940 [Candidatus Thermoplasmatota archaeon]|nr:hypothetical protein [Candidatus Thermoplasmatota archaeon]